MNNSFDNYSSAASAQSTPESKPQINTKSFAYIPLSPINKIYNSKFDSAHDIFSPQNTIEAVGIIQMNNKLMPNNT